MSEREDALSKLTALLPERLEGEREKVAVAWSGGADSTALLLALRARVDRLVAWHIDHGWRPESHRQAQWLARRAQEWGVAFHVARVPAAARNREAAARQQRYAQFARWAREQQVRHVYLAHHVGDQAETVCMRLLQGAGVQGCCGMAVSASREGLLLHRPWLQVAPGYLRRLLRQAHVDWIEDETNNDCTLWRNRIRHRLFPAMRRAGVEPHALFTRLQRQALRVAEELGSRVREVALEETGEGVRVAWDSWRRLLAAERAVLLQRMLTCLFGAGTCAGRRHIELVEAWTLRGGNGGLDLSRCRVQREKSYLHLRSRQVMLR
ncbi:MAG: tRNA lysidine(34) synthetase TilS [Zetaproteobacteria bacterium]|nr:MAG: tRNA lysidine(34) synthetase TilS [Zetaproteobacteria bacterium]